MWCDLTAYRSPVYNIALTDPIAYDEADVPIDVRAQAMSGPYYDGGRTGCGPAVQA
jgi:hypothetical protein